MFFWSVNFTQGHLNPQRSYSNAETKRNTFSFLIGMPLPLMPIYAFSEPCILAK